MDISVIGAGAIGNLVAGYLKLKGENVSLVGRLDTVNAIKEKKLRISGVRGDFKVHIDISDKLSREPDLIILATKTQDIEEALKNNAPFLKRCTVLTIQNGVQAEAIVSKYVNKENIISSIVMFGATYLEPGKVIHNFEGSWIIGRLTSSNPDAPELAISLVLDKAFPTVISEDIRGMKYLKVFVNANNCICAILGMSMQEAFSDLEISRISISIWKEGFEVISRSGIKLVSLPGFPVENLTNLTSLPALEAAKIFTGIMTKLSTDPLYGSILQSIKRGRISEIDYINGEFVNLAEANKLSAPLNKRLVEMVHQVEKNGKFFKKEELLAATNGLI